MGCICGKPLVKSSIERTNSQKNKEEHDSSINSAKLKYQIPSETSNDSLPKSSANEMAIPPAKKEKTYKISLPIFPKLDFYQFSSEPFNEYERSHLHEWQELIQVHHKNLELSLKPCNINNEALKNEWDLNFTLTMTKKILGMPPRLWIGEQIYIINQTLHKNKDPGANFKRKLIQLKYQFQWFVWALGNYFYICIGGKSRTIGKEFENFTGLKIEVPECIDEWLKGFVYKSVKFQLYYNSTPEANLIKSELKSLKLLYLETQTNTQNLIFPMIYCMKIGVFLLVASPVYPLNFFIKNTSLCLEIFGKTNFCIPEESIYRLKVDKENYFIFNASHFIPKKKNLAYVGVFRIDKDYVKITENYAGQEIFRKDIAKLISEDENFKIARKEFFHYGWKCFVFYDQNSRILRRHSFSQFFGDILGNFVVYFYYSKIQYSRFPMINVDNIEANAVLRENIKESINFLESSETLASQAALQELLHRKGLNSYHQWLIYSKCRSEKTAAYLESYLLSKALKVYINSISAGPLVSKVKQVKKSLVKVLQALLKPAYCGPDPLPQLGFILFMQRLKCAKEFIILQKNPDQSSSRIIDPINKKIHSAEFLTSNEMITKVLAVGCNHPKEFLSAIEYHFCISLDPIFIAAANNDKISFLENRIVVSESNILNLRLEIFGITSLREDSYISFVEISDKSYFGENSLSSINDSQILYFPKENDFSSVDMIIPGDLYSFGNMQFKSNYVIPNQNLLEEWANLHESLYKDIITPTGEEGMLIEIYILKCSLLISSEKDSKSCLSVLNKIAKIIENSYFIASDLIIAYYMWNGICQEFLNVFLSEQSFITALLLMTRAYGDPRGRGAFGIPWQMISSWKISKYSREDKRISDAQIAEEHYDSIVLTSNSYQQKVHSKYSKKFNKQQASIFSSPFENSASPQLDEIISWVCKNSLPMFSSFTKWNLAEINEYIRSTEINTMYSQSSQIINTSGTSTPSSYKDTRRGLVQSSLSQALMIQSCAIHVEDSKSLVYVWGTDTDGQLGVFNERENQGVLIVPRLLTGLKDVVITEVAVGPLHCVAVSWEGLCYAWGNNEDFQLGLGSEVPSHVISPRLVKAVDGIKKASCGYKHTLLLNSEGQVFSMGLGEGGVLGHTNSVTVKYPKMVLSLKKHFMIKIEAGAFHSVALTNEGSLYVWGRGEGGQLGLEQDELIVTNNEVFVDYPIRVLNNLFDKRITQVACGEAHNLALTDTGLVYAWGWGANGQLGNGYREEDFIESGNLLSIQYSPSLVSHFREKIKAVAAGGLFSMFLTENAEVFVCGANDEGKLGIEGEGRDVAIPMKIDSFLNCPILSISCGEGHSIAIAEKVVWSWGIFTEHQLGLGENISTNMPRPIQNFTNASIHKICCGRTHSVAIVGNLQKTYKKSEKMENCWKISVSEN